MILQTDIIRLGFNPKPEDNKGAYVKLVSIQTDNGWPAYEILLMDSTTEWKRMVIKKFKQDEGSAVIFDYYTVFDGEINSPADLFRLFGMLKIPLPKHIR